MISFNDDHRAKKKHFPDDSSGKMGMVMAFQAV